MLKKIPIFLSIILLAVTLSACQKPPVNSPSKTGPTSQAEAEKKDSLAFATNATVFLIKLDDNGLSGQAIGCGDSLVGIRVGVNLETSSDYPSVLTDKITKLLQIIFTPKLFADYYNVFDQMSLKVDRIEISDSKAEDSKTTNSKAAKIYLTGDFSLGGVCDMPRVEEQLKATVLQFKEITSVEFFINDKPLEEVLSLK